MTLMEFSIIPLDKGSSFSQYLVPVLERIDASGLPYRLNPMGTVVEGEWEDLLALLTACFRTLEKDSGRISVSVKFDHRKGVSNALDDKIKSMETKAGKSFRT